MSMEAVLSTQIRGLDEPKRGKVREVYDLGDDLLIVATDRISAFDVIMANAAELADDDDGVLGNTP